MKKRCLWANPDNPNYLAYHDTEWGVPVHNDQVLFEFLILEGAQAGLSWETILNKREEYKNVFHQFNIPTVAQMTDEELSQALTNPGIVRNKLKVFSARKNAQTVLQIQKEFGSFSTYLWNYVKDTQCDSYKRQCNIPVQTDISVTLSKDLKKRGCSFIGPTIMYAFMQAVGMVNDHTTDCFRYSEIS